MKNKMNYLLSGLLMLCAGAAWASEAEVKLSEYESSDVYHEFVLEQLGEKAVAFGKPFSFYPDDKRVRQLITVWHVFSLKMYPTKLTADGQVVDIGEEDDFLGHAEFWYCPSRRELVRKFCKYECNIADQAATSDFLNKEAQEVVVNKYNGKRSLTKLIDESAVKLDAAETMDQAQKRIMEYQRHMLLFKSLD